MARIQDEMRHPTQRGKNRISSSYREDPGRTPAWPTACYPWYQRDIDAGGLMLSVPRHRPIQVLPLLALLLFGTPGSAERLPLAAKGSAKPRLSLRFNTKKLEPMGKAWKRYVPPMTRISVASIEISARRHLEKAEALVRQAYAAGSKAERPALRDKGGASGIET